MRNPHERISCSISSSSSSSSNSIITTSSTSTVIYIDKLNRSEGGHKTRSSRIKNKNKNPLRVLLDPSKYKGRHDQRIMDAFSALYFLFRVSDELYIFL